MGKREGAKKPKEASEKQAISTWTPDPVGIYFSDYFGVHPDVLAKYGALDISVVTDLPLFIDPFLLFNSDKATYQTLHEGILEYLRFLRGKADDGLDAGLIRCWYSFREIKQNWLGFTDDGNAGHGLGGDRLRPTGSARRPSAARRPAPVGASQQCSGWPTSHRFC